MIYMLYLATVWPNVFPIIAHFNSLVVEFTVQLQTLNIKSRWVCITEKVCTMKLVRKIDSQQSQNCVVVILILSGLVTSLFFGKLPIGQLSYFWETGSVANRWSVNCSWYWNALADETILWKLKMSINLNLTSSWIMLNTTSTRTFF